MKEAEAKSPVSFEVHVARLPQTGLPVVVHRLVPAIEGGLALGLALVCLARAGADAG